MPYTGIVKRAGTCAICKKGIQAGQLVYFDASKSQGNHLAHEKCFIDLYRSRKKQPKIDPVVRSTEPLDPPF